MASCEKCWRDAGGDPREYAVLVEMRNRTGFECTPEEQAGCDAYECPACHRNTMHMICRVCMSSSCGYRDFKHGNFYPLYEDNA